MKGASADGNEGAAAVKPTGADGVAATMADGTMADGSSPIQPPTAPHPTTATHPPTTPPDPTPPPNSDFAHLPTSCPICHDDLNADLAMFPCGHALCTRCCFKLLERARAPVSHHRHVSCAMCKARAMAEDVAFVTGGGAGGAEAGAGAQVTSGGVDGESAVALRGSTTSTKIGAVVRRIKYLLNANIDERIVVCSSWGEVLDLVGHALGENGVGFVRAAGGRDVARALGEFKNGYGGGGGGGGGGGDAWGGRGRDGGAG